MKKTVLAIGAHPDDIEIGCGGTLAILKNQGCELIYLIVTSGEEGGLSMPKKDLADLREGEAKRAAQILGASQVLFLREPDGFTTFSKICKIRIISLIRDIRPQIVFTHSSSDHFPDHRVVHQLTMNAISLAAGRWYSEAGASPFQVGDVYGYEVWNPIPNYQLALDISSTLATKVEALQAHRSQVMSVDYVSGVTGLAKYRGSTSMVGAYAEVFEVLKARTL